MGLSGPRKKSKIGNDPNNTSWSRDTTAFGHNLLRSQGWTPGENLGAKDAAHAKHYTSASSSHIRISLKDDNLGLGAKRGSGQAAGECTGLDVFQSLLGRLNGKSDEVLKKEEGSRNDVKRAMYTDRRWGTMRFVRGGVLMGEEMLEGVKKEELKREADVKVEEDKNTIKVETTIEVKIESPEPSSLDLKMAKKDRRKRKREEESVPDVKLEAVEVVSVPVGPEASDSSEAEAAEAEDSSRSARKEEKARRKAEKAQRKLARAQKRESKAASRAAAGAVVAVATPVLMSGDRHAVRQRFIMQKRRATMDPKALNEIFMIKAK